MRIDFYTCSGGFLWACIHLTNNKYYQYFLGTKNINVRLTNMYKNIIEHKHFYKGN